MRRRPAADPRTDRDDAVATMKAVVKTAPSRVVGSPITVPVIVWFCPGLSVIFAANRFCVMSAGTTLPSAGLPGEVSVRMTVASSRRATRSYAPKNQTLSFAMKPPRSAPKSPSFAVFTVVVVV